MSIYVEAHINGSMDELWSKTQTPELHERWDLRFTSISYLKRAHDAKPQRFRYATRIGLGIEIHGWGETAGERTDSSTRSSALKFGSNDPRSLIHSGSGYWKYEDTGETLRFITGYDYDVRWGVIGRVLDRVAFRPLMGWATAWSFDCLRLWVEQGLAPERLIKQWLAHSAAATALAFVWLWHGLVPKLMGPHPDELLMLLNAGIPEPSVLSVVYAIGVAEVALGLLFLPFARYAWPWKTTILLMCAATLGVLIDSPEMVVGAFGPISLNVVVAALAAIGLLSSDELPSARRCLRRRPDAKSSEALVCSQSTNEH